MKRQEFMDALKLLRPGEGESSILGGPKVLFFDNSWLRTMNDKLSVSIQFDTGIQGILPFEYLYEAIKAMKGDELLISSNESQAVFKCGFSEATLNLFNEDQDFKRALKNALKRVHESANLDDVKWQPLPKRLLDGLKLTLLSAEDCEIGRLSGIVFTENLIISTDNYRISMYEMDDRIASESIRIKTSAAKAMLRMKQSFDQIGISEKWLHLKNSNLIVSLKQIPLADYPLEQVLKVFTIEFQPEVYKLPNNLEKFVSRAEVLAGVGKGEMAYGPQISLKSEDGRLVVTGENGVGSLSSSIPWNGVIPKVTINPQSLKDLLKLTRSFKVNENNSFVVFNIPNFKFMIIGIAEQVQEQVKQTKLEQLKALQQKN